MLRDMRPSRPSPAIVVAILALIAAVAGTAVAADPGATTSVSKKKTKKIANKQITKRAPGLSVANADNASNLGGQPPSAFEDGCPSGAPTRSGDLCFGPEQAATNWDAAERSCAAQNLRLPSIAEALLLFNVAASGTTWADEVVEVTPTSLRAIVNKDEPKIQAADNASNQTFRCVAHPTD